MKKLLLAGTTLLALNSKAQLTITTGLDTTAMSTLLEGLGVNINNMTINCSSGAYGQFSGISEIPISQGLVFSTGDALTLANSNTSTADSYSWGTAGDSDLNALAGTITYDACVLEFDAIPTGDTLFFNFAFGSEEYMEWVSAGFNDVFAIYISGNGFPTPTNIAMLPNNTIVSVVNVNANTNAQYYIDNETVPGTYVSLDGFTTNIGVEVVVVPSTPYHFKIAIADAMDGAVDSGVMLEAFSFRSVAAPLSVAENAVAFNMYPNPAHESLTLKFAASTADISITNAIGQEVFSKTNLFNGETLNIADLAAGSYLVKLSSEGKSSIQPLMITK